MSKGSVSDFYVFTRLTLFGKSIVNQVVYIVDLVFI